MKFSKIPEKSFNPIGIVKRTRRVWKTVEKNEIIENFMMSLTDLIIYLKREMTAAINEVEADSGSLADEIDDAAVGFVDDYDDSDDDWEFSPKPNPDDDEEYLKAMDIDIEFMEGSESFSGYRRKWLRYVNFFPTIEECNEEDETEEEDEPEEKHVEWWSGFDWAEKCEWLSGYSWAEECEEK